MRLMPVRRSRNGVGRINEVALRRARLILGWVTDYGRAYHHHSPRPTQPPTLSGTGNEYRSNCGNALGLGSKGRMAHTIRE